MTNPAIAIVQSQFTAFFTPESPYAFTVYPPNGILPAYNQEGTQLIVSFTPHEYGKTIHGTLVIQTDEMQWTYLVKGNHPQYKAPQVTTKIDNKLEPAIQQRILPRQPKNFLKKNLRAGR